MDLFGLSSHQAIPIALGGAVSFALFVTPGKAALDAGMPRALYYPIHWLYRKGHKRAARRARLAILFPIRSVSFAGNLIVGTAMALAHEKTFQDRFVTVCTYVLSKRICASIIFQEYDACEAKFKDAKTPQARATIIREFLQNIEHSLRSYAHDWLFGQWENVRVGQFARR